MKNSQIKVKDWKNHKKSKKMTKIEGNKQLPFMASLRLAKVHKIKKNLSKWIKREENKSRLLMRRI